MWIKITKGLRIEFSEMLVLIEGCCCRSCCWERRYGLQAGFLHNPGEATSLGSGRCHQTTSLGRSCPGRPSRPDKVVPLWQAAPQGTHSDLRLKTETVCQELTSETPHLEGKDVKQEVGILSLQQMVLMCYVILRL